MSEHARAKALELQDGVGDAINALVTRAAQSGEMIWAADAVKHLGVELSDIEMSPGELVEAVIRAAAAKGLPVAIQKPR